MVVKVGGGEGNLHYLIIQTHSKCNYRGRVTFICANGLG